MDHFQQVLSALKSHQDIEQLPNKSPEVMGLALKQHIFDLDQLSFPVLEPLLDKILDWTDKNLLDQTFPFSLLEDLMDLMVQEDVELLFDYIESRHDRLTKNLDPGFRTGKSIIILRMCNELLRRFSKTNSPTAGRIRVYLASITPLGERSGVNLGGQFIEEETVYEKLETNDPDALFYQRFWQCQEYFNAPSTFFERIDKALIDFDTILKRFQSMPQHKSTSTGFFSSRYLTSYKLFKLEMQSPSFRDQWILQLLILLQFARMFTQQEMEQLKPVISNNSVNYKYQMTPLQESKVIELSHQAELLLEPKFRKTILQVMKSEKKWVGWLMKGEMEVEWLSTV
ncbi:THO complex subunit 1 transcription elongation factor-domain-containing protein [Gorgonomyces haynaldii]|nr:THO complex subunit 1 transcription elongation factor-domain-containing protein [Gorgonomyces haynaldii]